MVFQSGCPGLTTRRLGAASARSASRCCADSSSDADPDPAALCFPAGFLVVLTGHAAEGTCAAPISAAAAGTPHSRAVLLDCRDISHIDSGPANPACPAPWRRKPSFTLSMLTQRTGTRCFPERRPLRPPLSRATLLLRLAAGYVNTFPYPPIPPSPPLLRLIAAFSLAFPRRHPASYRSSASRLRVSLPPPLPPHPIPPPTPNTETARTVTFGLVWWVYTPPPALPTFRPSTPPPLRMRR